MNRRQAFLFALVLFPGIALLEGRQVAHAALPPLSAEAVHALQNPPPNLTPSVAGELEAIWAERSRAFMRSVMADEAYEFDSQLWIDYLAGKPYLHFKASGQNRDYAQDQRRNVIVVLFIGPTREEIDAEFGSWFAPFRSGGQFIQSIDIGAQRAAHSNITDDGTHSIYWQQNNAFIEARSRDDVLGLARGAHASAQRTGLYNFPQSYLLTSFAESTAGVTPLPERGPSVSATPTPTPVPSLTAVPSATPPPQLSQEDLATGWERITEEAELIQSPRGSETPRPEAEPAPLPETSTGPRIPAATLGLALHAAIRRDEPSPVSALIRAGAGLESRDAQGRTPLMTAVTAASPDLVGLLLEEGARLEAIPVGGDVPPEDQGMTPLMLAAREGRASVTQTLVEAGASLSAVNGRGRTALEIATETGHEGVVRVLRRAAGLEPMPAAESTEMVAGPSTGEVSVAAEKASGEGTTPRSEGGVPGEAADSPPPAGAEGEVAESSSERPGMMEGEVEQLQTREGATLVTSIGEVRLWQARLEAAWKRLNVDLNEDIDTSILRAVILNWDARVTPDSTGVMGYEYWRAALADLSPENPVTAAEPSADLSDERVIQALRNAAANLRREFDTIEVPYRRRIY